MINLMLKSHNQDVFPVRTESKRALERMELSRNKRKMSYNYLFFFKEHLKAVLGWEQVGSGV